MIKNYAIAFLVIEAILVGLVFIDAPVNSLLYTTIMSLIMIVIIGAGSMSIFYAFSRSSKSKRMNQLSKRLGVGLIAIFAFLLLRLVSHLTLLQIVTLSKFTSQISGVTQVALVIVFFYIQYDILKDMKK